MRTELLASNSDLAAVGLVGDAVNLLDVVRVGDDLIVGDKILQSGVRKIVPWKNPLSGKPAMDWRKGGVVAQQGRAGAYLVDDHVGGLLLVG